MMTRPKVAIAGPFPFPYGSASASRVRHLAAGLHRAGCEVHVVSVLPPLPFGQNDELTHGINVHRVILNEELGLLIRAKLIVESMRNVIKSHGIQVLLIYGGRIDVTFPLLLAAKLSSLTTIAEICEWFPANQFKRGCFEKEFLSELTYRNLVPLLSDGVLCISSYIQKKVSKLNRQTIIIPALVDVRRSPTSSDANDGSFRVVYSGNFKKEDAAHVLIQAVRLCLSRGINVKLEMIGGWGGENEAHCKSLVDADPLLKSCVSFTGYLWGEEYLRRIATASCLVMVRPHGQIHVAGFPTRLPEFLMTGKPVIISSAGDIERYLTAGIHAHILDRVNPETLADAIGRIYSDREYAKTLGHQGRKAAETAFDYVAHGERLATFLRGLSQ